MRIHLLDARIPKGERVYAIGDIHGCLSELELLLTQIADDLADNPVRSSTIVFLGDYVDRGPDSCGVIARLIELQNSGRNTVFIKGNHEDKFLAFLDRPVDQARQFFTYGGAETAMSYGVKGKSVESPLRDAAKIRDKLLGKMPKKHLKFLAALKISHSIGDFFFCHAGIRPSIKLAKQSTHDLMWIRQDFLLHSGLHSKVIAHGHTPQFEPEVMANRINVDTKCYGSGILSCVVLEKRRQRFLQTGVEDRKAFKARRIG